MPFASACLVARGDAAAPARAPRPVLASTALRADLEAPSHGRVLAVLPAALYVQVGAAVLAVVASDGLRLPNALVVAEPARTAPFARHAAADPVEVRDGALHVGRTPYLPVRWWSPRAALPGPVPAPLPATVVELADRLSATAPAHHADVEQALAGAARALHRALAGRCTPAAAAAARAAADQVLGLGPGLTPSGDDLLAGVLVTCVQLGAAELVRPLGRHVATRAGQRTTALSATLLRCAAGGLAAAPVLGLVDAVVGRHRLDPALSDLLAVGHTSGHDTARGVHVAAAALLEHGTAGAPPSGGADLQEDT